MSAGRSRLECVLNVSEGRDVEAIHTISAACGDVLLDVHHDRDHHRAVLTLGGEADTVEAAARAATVEAVGLLDIRSHRGAHPRLGIVDVVPFVPLPFPTGGVTVDLSPACAWRDRFATWAAGELSIPCFLYGPERSLPEVRRQAFGALTPDFGPLRPHPRAGAIAVGARPVLVAYNVWIGTAPVQVAKAIARTLRNGRVRALGFEIGGKAQVSCNLLDPGSFGPAQVYDAVARLTRDAGEMIDRAELVGLLTNRVLTNTPQHRWAELGLSPSATIEARLADSSLRTR